MPENQLFLAWASSRALAGKPLDVGLSWALVGVSLQDEKNTLAGCTQIFRLKGCYRLNFEDLGKT